MNNCSCASLKRLNQTGELLNSQCFPCKRLPRKPWCENHGKIRQMVFTDVEPKGLCRELARNDFELCSSVVLPTCFRVVLSNGF